MKCAVVPVTPFQQNCSIIWSETTKEGAAVDPGGDLDRVMATVEAHEVRLTKILITHGHLDHAGGAADLADTLKLPIEGPNEADQFLIDDLPESAARFGFPSARAFTPDRWLAGGDTVVVGDLTLEVIHCPGHTPGHVVYLHRPSRFAVVGDVLFRGSIGRTDFPRGDHEALIRSIRERLFPLGDDIVFLPGHGPTSTFGFERQSNPYVSDLAVGAA